MTCAKFQCAFLVAEQLPLLEILYLDEKKLFKVGVLDMTGCKQLGSLPLSP